MKYVVFTYKCGIDQNHFSQYVCEYIARWQIKGGKNVESQERFPTLA